MPKLAKRGDVFDMVILDRRVRALEKEEEMECEERLPPIASLAVAS